MKILMLDYEIPSPVNSGNKMRTWNFIKTAALENDVSILCRTGNADEGPSRGIKEYCKNVWVAGDELATKKVNGTNRVKNLLRGIPWEIAESYSNDYEKKFLELIESGDFDLIFARYIFQGQYLLRNIDKIKAEKVVDLDDIETVKSKRIMASEHSNGLYDRLRRHLNNELLEHYHGKLNLLDKCIVCSRRDAEYISSKGWTDKSTVVPNCIDVDNYSLVRDYNNEAMNRKTILCCGNLGYGPNVDAIVWFVKEVFPLIKRREPTAKLKIVGRNPAEGIYNCADGDSVVICPNVPSIIPYYEDSSLAVVPLRSGGGTRIKILEALACRRPVVSTSIGAEGLEMVSGKHCMIEDEPEKFADICIRILSDYDIAKSLTIEGWKFVKENYDWEVVSKTIKGIFSDA